MAGPITIRSRDVLAFRFRRHQLDRPAGSVAGVTDVDLLDYGVQDTGTDGSAWALAIRGAQPVDTGELALAWTLRGAPHAYRRVDLSAIAVATAPFSEADAAKRIFDATKPLKAAGIPVLEALGVVAACERDIVTQPTLKGELSSRLTPLLDAPYLRFCRPCNATHSYEQTFRLAALQGGLELEPETSPPVLRRIPKLRPPMLRQLAGAADKRFDVILNYVRFYGPARVRDVAEFVDAPQQVVKQHWPDDAVEVSVSDVDSREPRFVLADDIDALCGAADELARGTVRLAGPQDPYVQLRDRDTLVAHEARRKEMWRIIGRPGAVLADGDLVGTWRPRTSGRTLTITVEPWTKLSRQVRAAIEEEAQRLADHRGGLSPTVRFTDAS